MGQFKRKVLLLCGAKGRAVGVHAAEQDGRVTAYESRPGVVVLNSDQRCLNGARLCLKSVGRGNRTASMLPIFIQVLQVLTSIVFRAYSSFWWPSGN